MGRWAGDAKVMFGEIQWCKVLPISCGATISAAIDEALFIVSSSVSHRSLSRLATGSPMALYKWKWKFKANFQTRFRSYWQRKTWHVRTSTGDDRHNERLTKNIIYSLLAKDFFLTSTKHSMKVFYNASTVTAKIAIDKLCRLFEKKLREAHSLDSSSHLPNSEFNWFFSDDKVSTKCLCVLVRLPSVIMSFTIG